MTRRMFPIEDVLSTPPADLRARVRRGVARARRLGAPRLRWAAAWCLGGCVAAASAQGVEPGLWQVWVSASPDQPKGAPQAEYCLRGNQARDLMLYGGETPGDSTCRARGVRPGTGSAFEFTLECPGFGPMTVQVQQPDRSRFSARLARSPSHPRLPGPVHVHGMRVGACRP